jgi:hypothetical protein
LEGHARGQSLHGESFMVEGHPVTVSPFVLPFPSRMKPGELDRAGGRESLKTGHGFYVYRGGRLVVPGGWFRIVPSDELIRLARVRVDIPVELDHLWRIDTEVLPLLWRQVDFAAGEVRIDDPRSTKNEQARVFPFTQDLRRAPLRAPAEADRGARLAIRVLPLARLRAGRRFSYSGFYKAWQRAVRAAGVARVPHDFRRTAIRNLERDGVPRSVAMAMVGQKTEEVYRRYAIVDEAMIREAAVKMNRGAKTRRATAQRSAGSASSV